MYHKLTLSLSSKAVADMFATELESLCGAVSLFEEETDTDRWRLEGYCAELPDPDLLANVLSAAAGKADIAIPDIQCLPLPDMDWLAENRKSFPPVRIGRFFIHPSHYDGPPPANRLRLELDATTAFGTGEHATTRGCLLALQDLQRHLCPNRVLDLGCGTGILAMAAARLWPTTAILASDIDTAAVQVARRNLRNNRLARSVETVCCNGVGHPALRKAGPYDLIIANILAGPLRRMARDLTKHGLPGGFIILSGLLEAQEAMVLSAYRLQGFCLVRRFRDEGWSTLVLQKAG